MHGYGIENRIFEIANSYDYNEKVCQAIEEYKKELNKEKTGYIIYLNAKISREFAGASEEEIAQKVSKEVIEYRIKEKALVKLMAEGVIYPVGTVGTIDGWERRSVTYAYGSSTSHTNLNFRRLVFTEFMKA